MREVEVFPSKAKHSFLRVILAVGVLAASTGASLFGQTAGAGTITGTISDPAGAVVPEASVVVHNTETGADRATTTNGAGIYSAPALQPGAYEITVSKTGFNKIERKGLTLEVGRTLTIDFALAVESGSQTVSITAEAPVVDTEKTEVSQEVSQDLVNNLPIVGRRWDNFVLLTPGTTADGGLVSYRGISGLYNNNSVDGANNNQAFFSEARGRSTTPYTYSIDAIQEFQVSSSNYSAEFGQAAGGIVNAITKSGTNATHGDLFYFLRYPSLNALDPFNKSKGIYTQAVHQQQQFGGSVGGAVKKDKLFYFLNYDGSRKVFPIVYTSTSVFPLACPASTGVTAAQCAAANNWLASTVAGYGRTGVGDVAFGKLDYQLNSRNRLSANFDWDNYHAPNSYNSSTSVNNSSVTTNGTLVTHTRFVIGKWDVTLTPSMLNNIRVQWADDKEIAGANSGGPSVSVTNVTTYGMPNALPRPAFPDEHRFQIADTLSWQKGRHQIKLGYDINVIHELLINLFQGGGIYSYTSFNNWIEDVYGINVGDGATGKHFSSFTQVTDPITGVGKDDFYDNDYAGFFEDSWKVRPNLTVNMGMRYEIQKVPQPLKPNLTTPLNAILTSKINTDSNNFGPRIGIAWEPMKGTVVRAGYGMFYAKTTNSTWYTVRVENGIYQQTYTCSPVPTAATYCPALTFPNLIFTPPGATPAAPFVGALTPRVTPFTPPAAGQLSRGTPSDFVNPLVHEGDVTIEKQVPGNVSISAAWLFSRGLHLPAFVDANLLSSTTTHTYAVLNADSTVNTKLTLPWYPGTGTNNGRIDPGTGDILTGYSVVNSWYNALVLSARKPFSNGFEALVNFTFSKSTDDGAVGGANGTFNGTDYTVDPKNQKAENSVSDLYQKYRLTSSLVWAPRMAHSLSNRAAKAVLDGWMLSSTITIGSPLPVFNTINGFPSGGADFGLTGGEVTNTGGSTGGRPPQVSRNFYFGATQIRNVDFRITRDFPIWKEKVKMQIIGEAFNLFNHTIVSSVNSTSFNFVNAGTGACTSVTGGTNGCLTPSTTFLAPTSTSSTNGLYGARQLQFAAKFVF